MRNETTSCSTAPNQAPSSEFEPRPSRGRLAAAKALAALFWVEVAAVLVAVALCFGGLPFGVTPYVVQSGSMTPALPVGAIVYVDTNADPEGLVPGDVIAFDLGEGKTCTHRIEACNADGTYTTKGDANEFADKAPVDPSEVIGTVTFDVPLAGYLLAGLTQHRAAFAACAFAALIGTYGLSRLLERKGGRK